MSETYSGPARPVLRILPAGDKGSNVTGVAAAEVDRRKLALAALGLPIVGMIALFTWAGAASAPSSTGIVQRFLSAYNGRDCASVSQALYKAPGVKTPTCTELFGRQPAKFESCSETVLPSSATTGLLSRVPSGYTSVRLIRATCTRKSAVGAPARVALDFLVADSPSGQPAIITIGAGG